MNPLHTSFTILRRRGPGYFGYLLFGWLVPRLLFRWRAAFPGNLLRWFSLPALVLRERARALTPAVPNPANFTSWATLPVEPQVRAAVEAARRTRPQEPLPIGRFDDDGRLLGLFGNLPGVAAVSREDFVERKRFDLSLVVWGDSLLVRKDYRGDAKSFIREWAALAMLAGKVNVPALHHVDEKRTVLYKNFVWGRTIREILVDHGARILHGHSRQDAELASINQPDRIKAVWRRGRELLPKVVGRPILAGLAEQLERVHTEGVAGVSLTWGNVVIEEGTQTPWLIDLDKAWVLPSCESGALQLLRDREREQFNELYGVALLTEASARAALAEQSRKLPGWYAPIDFGRGLTVGGFWTTDSGTGRWECVNGPVLDHLLPGKRILDLGSNNGIMPVMMLRAGAREVLGVELSPDYAECAQLVRRLFEWRDQRHYPLRLHIGNMLDILCCDWGRFDVVTAFCSLYYLEPREMAAVVRKAAQLAPMIVVQAKTDTRKNAAENKAEKSSLPFLKALLEENGFSHVEVFAPKDCTRPLLVATALTKAGVQQAGDLAPVPAGC